VVIDDKTDSAAIQTPQGILEQHAITPGSPGVDKQRGTRKDQLPGAVEVIAGEGLADASEQRVRRAHYGRVLNTTVGLPYRNGRRILPQYLLDHCGKCNKVQLCNKSGISAAAARYGRANRG
jgi:hypothetical protein